MINLCLNISTDVTTYAVLKLLANRITVITCRNDAVTVTLVVIVIATDISDVLL